MRSDWNRHHPSYTRALETLREEEGTFVHPDWLPSQRNQLEKKKHTTDLENTLRRATLMSRSFRNRCNPGSHPCRVLTVGILFFMLVGTIGVASFSAKADFTSPKYKEQHQTTHSIGTEKKHAADGLQAGTKPEVPSYVVVLDAGSTGTRVYVYSARRDEKGAVRVERALTSKEATSTDITEELSSKDVLGRKGGAHNLHEAGIKGSFRRTSGNMHSKAYHRMETTPGLAKIVEHANNPSSRRADIGVALKPLLTWAEKVVAPALQPKTPIVLLATGGARALSEKDQRNLLQDVEVSLVSSKFDAGHGSARILKGEDEAVLGFVALNFVSPSGGGAVIRREEQWKEAKSIEDGGDQTQSKYSLLDGAVGTIDLGGSSLEIATPVRSDAKGLQLSEIRLGGAIMAIYTKTFEGYGLESAFSRSLVSLAYDQLGAPGGWTSDPGERQLLHPCLHRGYSRTEEMYYRSNGEKAEWHTGKEAVAEMPKVEVLLKGSPDLEQCKSLARSIARLSDDQKLHEVLEKGIIMPLSGFHVLRHFFKVDPYASWSILEAQVDEFCSMDWSQVTQNDHFMTEAHPEKFCLWGYFANAVLHDSTALGLKEHQLAPVRGDLSWADGAALLEADRLFRREGKTTALPMVVVGDESLHMHPTTVKIAIFALSISMVFALLVLSSAGIGPPWLNQLMCGSCRSKEGTMFQAGTIPLWKRSYSKPKHSRSLSAPGLDYQQ